MKNILFILAISWLFAACNNQQDEILNDNKKAEIEKDSLLRTRSLGQDTIILPAPGVHIYARSEIIHFYLGSPSSKDFYFKYGESMPPPYWTGCYIQYRFYDNHSDHNWYYYNPDSIMCKTPYINPFYPTIPFVLATGPNGLELKATKFPASAFQYRSKLLGHDQSNNIYYETEWQEDGTYSFETLYGNNKGFIEPGLPPSAGIEYVDISVRITLNVELHLDARGSAGFTHILRLDNQKSPEFQVASGDVKSFNYTFTIYKTMENLPINSIQEIRMPFEDSEYINYFYINPDKFNRYIEINDFKDIYISGR